MRIIWPAPAARRKASSCFADAPTRRTRGGVHGLDTEHEDIRVLTVDEDAALAWLDEGRFDNAMTLVAMQWFKINRDELKQKWLNTPK